MNLIATYARFTWATGIFAAFSIALTGCTLPRSASTPLVYDFGPGSTQAVPAIRIANLPPLELSAVQASTALNSTAVFYRLAYADAQQLKPYTLARWSMPPAQLIGQRLRDRLGQRRPVVAPGDIFLAPPARQSASQPVPVAKAESLMNLRLELEEFSQVFETPDNSSGQLRLRATLMLRGPAGDTLVAQRSFYANQTATSADASGGVRALTAATDQAVTDIEAWLEQVANASQ